MSTSPAPLATITTLSSTTRPAFVQDRTTWSDNHEDNQTFPPITTHWTAPRHCTYTYNAETDVASESGSGVVAWLDLEPVAGASSLSCYPDGMFFQGRTGVFSPATCPNGWTTVSLRVNTNEVRNEATTTAVCCSSDFNLEGDMCRRTIPTVLAVPILYNHTARTYSILSESTTTLYSAQVAAYTIRALFQESDKKSLGLQDEEDIGTEEEHGSLSLRAKIGIGMGSAVFVLILIAGAAFFLIRKEKARAKKKRSHELDAMQRRSGDGGEGDSYLSSEMHERRDRCCDHQDPPPAYERATDSVGGVECERRLSGETTSRDEEIRVLRVQKEAIERRIGELQQSDSSGSQDQARAP